ISGDPRVTDTLSIEEHTIRLQRHVLSFFQGNRYLLEELVQHVAGQIADGSEVVDLYAGVGLFAISVALSRGSRVIAVERDRTAARDLKENAAASQAMVDAVRESVE